VEKLLGNAARWGAFGPALVRFVSPPCTLLRFYFPGSARNGTWAGQELIRSDLVSYLPGLLRAIFLCMIHALQQQNTKPL
jgi:hypothetical protein